MAFPFYFFLEYHSFFFSKSHSNSVVAIPAKTDLLNY